MILRTVAFVAVVACASSTPVTPVPLTGLETASLRVSVNGQEVVLTPYLWRDFQPIAPPDGQPLIAIFRVARADGGALEGNLSIDAAWVVKGGDVWSGTVGEARFAAPTRIFYEVVMRGGPKWGPGITVDAVVRVRDAKGEAQLLRATNVHIDRTD